MSYSARGTMYHEKQEMQGLNDRLAAYMDKVRQLKQAGKTMDPEKYREAMRQLEDELKKLKSMYENEIDKLRLADANAMNRKLSDQLDKVQRRLAEKEKEASENKNYVDALKREIEQLKPNYMKSNRDADELKRRLADEMNRRKEAEEKIKQLQDKMAFDSAKMAQERRDLAERLKTANEINQNLENKLRNAKEQGVGGSGVGSKEGVGRD
ncbi:hypothetical protein LSH36_458g01016 [Paralvinella palmiformis]|uniref:IF rod domain-containing protein n=1 Tax=Paralvinella palmiformis TaxID=53620 RepID=A0AAD9MXB6_9ANNE|nr:hypothetical protein LSH36_458g01016 [Paralvinella palmiformis]